MRIYQLFLALILGFIVISCQPEDKRQLKMSPLFSDHMVLQQNQDIAFWGEYSPMKKITLSGSWGDEATTESDANGQWKMTLTSPAAGGPYSINVISADSTIMIDDVLFGEVWLASGQSNMEMPLKGWPPNDPIANSSEEISNANYPNIRMFTVARNLSGAPLDTIRGQWVASSPETAGDFSASAYFFARRLQDELKVPIGIIHSSWGGTPAEAWTSSVVLRELGDFNTELDAIEKSNSLEKETDTVNGPDQLELHSNMPSVLFNAMINPLLPYTIKGAIWYQGESNVGRDEQYKRVFPAMINDWRNRWADDFPFYFVQIAPYIYNKNPDLQISQKLRDAQRHALKTAKTGMVVTLDIGNPTNIHPANKQDVGYRLAGLALANDYGKAIVASGPLFKGFTKAKHKLVVAFDFVGSGLLCNEKKLKGFEIAGADKVFESAKAKIKNGMVEVSSRSIKNPEYVRYAWKDDSQATLFNLEGLPASSFSSE